MKSFKNNLKLLLCLMLVVSMMASMMAPALASTGEGVEPCTEHIYAEGVCTLCGATEPQPQCSHESHNADGKCANCGADVAHVYTDGVCACGATEPQPETCTACGKAAHEGECAPTEPQPEPTVCSHVSDGGVVTLEPTCSEKGVITYSCTVDGCDYSEIDYIDPKGHSYNADHVCSVCGAAEPMMTTIGCTGDDSCGAAADSHKANCVKTVANIGDKGFVTLADAFNAVADGQTITLTKNVELAVGISFNQNISFTFDGNNKTISPASGCTETSSVFNFSPDGSESTRGGRHYNIVNTVFSGWTTDHVVRLQGVTAQVTNCSFTGCNQPDGLGLLTLTFTDATVSGCTFTNNTAVELIDNNSWGDGSTSSTTISNCTFSGNTVSGAALVLNSGGNSISISGCTFSGNTINTNGNAAPLFLWAGSATSVTGCTFSGNTVGSTGSDAVIAGSIFGEGITISGNKFLGGGNVDNEVSLGGTAPADVSGNYWGGAEPKVEVKAGAAHTPVIKSYFTDDAMSSSVKLLPDGSGTEADPYQIGSKEELFKFAELVNNGTYKGVHVILTDNIDLDQEDWTSIGTSVNPFTGTFDGNGKTISNLWSYDRGLFGYTSTGNYVDTGLNGRATIKNLTVSNASVINQSTSYVGGIVGSAGQNTELSNVKLTGEISVFGSGYVGGIVGHGHVHVDNCHVDGISAEVSEINASYWAVGGIVGFAGSDSGTSITNCSVKNVTIRSAVYGAGSIAGVGTSGPIENVYAESVKVVAASEPDANGLLVGCNYNKITGNSTTSNVSLTVGGIDVKVPQDMVAVIDGTYYASLQAAVNVAENGNTIKLVKNVSLSPATAVEDIMAIPTGVTLDLNGKHLFGTVTGNISVNGGSWKTNDFHQYEMICSDEATDAANYNYHSADGVFNANAYGALTMLSGTVTLNKDAMTVPGQTTTIAQGATFVIPAGRTFTIRGEAIVEGTVTVAGKVVLGENAQAEATLGATLKAPKDLPVESGISTHKVVYVGGVYRLIPADSVALVGTTGYKTIADANTAAVSATDKTILLIDDVAGSFTLGEGVTLDLNGKTLTGNAYGTVSVNGGKWKAPVPNSSEFYYILSPNSSDGAMYVSSDAVLVLAADGALTMQSGTVTLGQSWRTDLNQSVTIGSAATFVIPEGKEFTVRGTAVVNGTVTVDGKVILGGLDVDNASNVSITAPTGLNVESGMDGYYVFYEGGKYILKSEADAAASIGETLYPNIDDAIAAAKDGDTVKIIKAEGSVSVVDKDITIDIDGAVSEDFALSLEDSTVTISADDLAAIKNGAALEDSSLKVGDNTVGMTDGAVSYKKDSKELYVKPAAGAVVSVNGAAISFENVNSSVTVVMDEKGNAAIPADATVTLSNGSKITVVNPANLDKDGVLTVSPANVNGAGYGRIEITHKDGSKDAVLSAQDEKNNNNPYALTIKVLSNGKLEIKTVDKDAEDPILDTGANGGYLEYIKADKYFYKYGVASMRFTINGFYGALEKVTVTSADGKYYKELGSKEADMWTGSTEIKLKNSYLKNLELGKYTLTASYADGESVSTSFTVGKTPATGDNGFGAYAAVMAVALAGMAAIIVLLKKKGRA